MATDPLAPTTLAPPPLAVLARMTSLEILTTYGPEVMEMVGRLQASGQLVRDGRSNQDLTVQAQMREIIAREGDCGPADLYAEELAEREAEKRLAEEEAQT